MKLMALPCRLPCRVLPTGQEQRLEPADRRHRRPAPRSAMIFAGQCIEPAGIGADRAQERHRFEHQVRRLHDDVAHLAHLRLEAFDLEQVDDLGGLVHLIDGVVHRRDQVLDVGAIERRDEGAAHRDQDLAGDFVGFGLALENLLAVALDAVAALQQSAQCLGAGDDDGGVPREELEEPLFPGHQRLKPAEHRGLACGWTSNPGNHVRWREASAQCAGIGRRARSAARHAREFSAGSARRPLRLDGSRAK